jgi:WD40 repeat protein
VVHEETGKASTYVIATKDVAASIEEEDSHSQLGAAVSALAVHPRDANQVLIAYEECAAVFLWDFAKRKVVKEYSLAKKSKMSAVPPEEDGQSQVNSVQSLSWHSSGKRFVAGFKCGGFAVFRADKSTGFYHTLPIVEGDAQGNATAIHHLQWVCPPPSSRYAHYAGAIVLSGGRPQSEKSLLTILYPRNGSSPDDAMVELFKSEELAWNVTTVESLNHAEIVGFAVAQDQVDTCSKIAPLSTIVLSGNPLDGCLPCVSVQHLPCFIKFRSNDQEEWEWKTDQFIAPMPVLPLLQLSPLKTFALVDLVHADGVLQDDLLAAWANNGVKRGVFGMPLNGADDDYEWPINGGSIMEPLLKGYLASSGGVLSHDDSTGISMSGAILLTGHENGSVLFWDVVSPGDRASTGAIHLIHVVDTLETMASDDSITVRELSCLAFCRDSRILVAGFNTGEIAVFAFSHLKTESPAPSEVVPGQENAEKQQGVHDDPVSDSLRSGYRLLFRAQPHELPITKISLSTSYGFIAVADTSGEIALVNVESRAVQLLNAGQAAAISESTSVESLLMSELVQTADIPVAPVSESKRSPGKSRRTSRSETPEEIGGEQVELHREVVPVLFVGRGSGKLEMYHVQSAVKIGETLVDSWKTAGLSSLLMIDINGRRVDVPGRGWTPNYLQQSGQSDPSSPVVDASGVNIEVSNDPEGAALNDGAGTTDEPTSSVVEHTPEMEHIQQLFDEAIGEQSPPTEDAALPPAEATASLATRNPSSWTRVEVVEVSLAPGPLGLRLFTEIEEHGVIYGFVPDIANAIKLEGYGVGTGHTITSIDGLDVTPFNRLLVCRVLEKLRDQEKVITFARGFEHPIISANTPALAKDDGQSNTARSPESLTSDLDQPRLLMCTCGRSIHLMQPTLPRASEIAQGAREMPAEPLATVELRSPALITSIIRIPIEGQVENCLAVVDQSNDMYIISLLSLTIVWQADGSDKLGNALVNGIGFGVSYGGELFAANEFGEIERFSFLSEQVALEAAMLERKSIKTSVYLPERAYQFTKDLSESPKKKVGITDAGKMFKKLVMSVKQDADLKKVFQFASPEDERQRLFGQRANADSAAGESTEAQGTAKVSQGMNATKDALMQAHQVRDAVWEIVILHYNYSLAWRSILWRR